MKNPFASNASKRLAAINAQLAAVGIDPNEPDIGAAITAKIKAEGGESAEKPGCFGGEGEPEDDCADCPHAGDCTNPNKEAKKEARKQRDTHLEAFGALLVQASEMKVDLVALAKEPKGLATLLDTERRAAVKKALGENAPENIEHVESEGSLNAYHQYKALKEAGKETEATKFFAVNKFAILDQMGSEATTSTTINTQE